MTELRVLAVRNAVTADMSAEAAKPPSKGPVRNRVRAFSPKVRTGCLTCKIRHKKCDEAKPTCQRCRNDSVVCDGYVTPMRKSRKKTSKLGDVAYVAKGHALSPLYTPDPWTGWSTLELHFFHHFATFAYRDLTEAPSSQSLWLSYALPLAHQNHALRWSIAAVGAAHHCFLSEESTRNSSRLDSSLLSLSLYNRAIACITQDRALDPDTVLLCCLLFICFESMTGRYIESMKHLRAGLRLLESMGDRPCDAGPWLRPQMYNLYVQLSIEFSNLIESSALTPSQPHRLGIDLSPGSSHETKSYASPMEAVAVLRSLDLEFQILRSQVVEEDEEEAVQALMCNMPRGASPQVTAYDAIMDRVDLWIRRCKRTIKSFAEETSSSTDRQMLARLKFLHSVWMLISRIHWKPDDQEGIKQDGESLLQNAEELAQVFIHGKRRTFSMEGDLISGVSLAISFSMDRKFQARACALLESLNRREGVWDSGEIAEMHRATLAQEQPVEWYTKEIHGGIPGYVRAISSVSPIVKASNGLLQLTLPEDGAARSL